MSGTCPVIRDEGELLQFLKQRLSPYNHGGIMLGGVNNGKRIVYIYDTKGTHQMGEFPFPLTWDNPVDVWFIERFIDGLELQRRANADGVPPGYRKTEDGFLTDDDCWSDRKKWLL